MKAEELAKQLYPDKEGTEGICATWLQRNSYVKGYKDGLLKDLKGKVIEGKLELNHIVLGYNDLAEFIPNKKHGDKVKIVIISD